MQIRLCVGLVVVAGLLGNSVLHAGGGFSCMRGEARIGSEISQRSGPRVSIRTGDYNTINVSMVTAENIARARRASQTRDGALMAKQVLIERIPGLVSKMYAFAAGLPQEKALKDLIWMLSKGQGIAAPAPEKVLCPAGLAPERFSVFMNSYELLYNYMEQWRKSDDDLIDARVELANLKKALQQGLYRAGASSVDVADFMARL